MDVNAMQMAPLNNLPLNINLLVALLRVFLGDYHRLRSRPLYFLLGVIKWHFRRSRVARGSSYKKDETGKLGPAEMR
jgi:hypothetical protein